MEALSANHSKSPCTLLSANGRSSFVHLDPLIYQWFNASFVASANVTLEPIGVRPSDPEGWLVSATRSSFRVLYHHAPVISSLLQAFTISISTDLDIKNGTNARYS